jgi:hypothetical protein
MKSSSPTISRVPIKTLTPKSVPTRTSIPTTTLQPELSEDEVGLPWNPSSISSDIPEVRYKPCYVNTSTRWHAGDVFMWELNSGQVIDVISPVSGKVLYATIDKNGGNIIVQTPYQVDGQKVYYQLRHFSTINKDVKEGEFIEKAQRIGTLRWDGNKDPGGYSILDFMLYHGNDWTYDTETEVGRNMFLDTSPYHLDDLSLIKYQQVPRCEGNPK